MKYKAVIFDMDGTLIRNTDSVTYLCLLHQVNQKILADINYRELHDEISWIDADYERAKLICGLSLEKIKTHFDHHIQLINGIEETINILKNRGVIKLLVTAGPKQVAEVITNRYGFDDHFGSEYETIDGQFTGRITFHMRDSGKVDCLRNGCKSRRISLKDCAAVGNSSSDIELFKVAGRSIALNADVVTRKLASCSVDTNNLSDILSFFG